MCNLPAWLRAACLLIVSLLTACSGSDEHTAEPTMTLSGRVTAEQPMSNSDVVGTWSAISYDLGIMGVSLSSTNDLKYRLAQTDQNGTPLPAGLAKWRIINNVLIIKWPEQDGQDECVSLAGDTSLSLYCTTIGGAADGETVQFDLTKANLVTELPGTAWIRNQVVMEFPSSTKYTLYYQDREWTLSWSSQGLRMNLNEFATCDFAGWTEGRTSMFLACRYQGLSGEYLTVWGRSS